MKTIINAKIYNTDTATEVASWGNGMARSDFRNLRETLYRTKSGAWFLHGEGGALTQWAESHGRSKCEGEGIEPLSEAGVLQWCSEHQIDPDLVAEYITVPEA